MAKRLSRSDMNDLTDLIQRMSGMSENHDPAVKGHLARIGGYVATLALGYGLSMADVEMTSLAAQLHDIGKIGLPESLRTARGKLSEAELELNKKHTRMGADLLKESKNPVIQIGAAICLSHHERWDGSGYPQSLSGEQIPLSARLTGLADVFDALTTPRPYKDEVSLSEARHLITESSGELFEPALVKIFNENFDEFQRLRQTLI